TSRLLGTSRRSDIRRPPVSEFLTCAMHNSICADETGESTDASILSAHFERYNKPIVSVPAGSDQRIVKYTHLWEFLVSVPSSQLSVLLSFERVEEVLGFSLPQ